VDAWTRGRAIQIDVYFTLLYFTTHAPNDLFDQIWLKDVRFATALTFKFPGIFAASFSAYS